MGYSLYLKIFFTFFCYVSVSSAETIDDLFQKAENARNAYKDMEAVGYYHQILQIDSNNFQALWNTSYIYQRVGWLEENREMKRQSYIKAIDFANKAYSKFPSTYEANIVMAGALARMSEFLSAKEKVHASRDIKKYGDFALSLNPNDPEVWYLVGWLNFELSKATWIERSMASILFGGLPKDISSEEAIRCLNKANELKPGYIVYMYDLATFYERTEDTATAIQWTRKALAIHPVAPEDFIYREKCRNLLSRLSS